MFSLAGVDGGVKPRINDGAMLSNSRKYEGARVPLRRDAKVAPSRTAGRVLALGHLNAHWFLLLEDPSGAGSVQKILTRPW